MTVSLRHFVAAAAVASAPVLAGSAFAQDIPELPVVSDLLGGAAIPDIELGPVLVDLDVPADNGDPIDLTIYITPPDGDTLELPGDVTTPLVEALLGTGGGAGGTPDLPIVGDLLAGGLPTDPSAIPVLGDILAGGGAGGLPVDPADLLGSLPSDPTALPVVGEVVAALLSSPTDLLDPATLPVVGDVLGGGAGGLPIDPVSLLDPSSLPLDPTALLGGGAGGLPINPTDLLGSLPLDPASLLGGGAGGLPVDLGTLPVLGDVLGSVI